MSDNIKVTIDGEDYDVELKKNGNMWTVTVQGQKFEITTNNLKNKKNKVKRRKRKLNSDGVISSTIPGKIIVINNKIGDNVKEGDVLIILEAMKMQNEITAPISGKITEINCTNGGSIEANMPLIIIDNIDR
ncbi:MAG: acetyl-CoA carboxylase biotin carboxyl carrier protein subunit [Euryarchaeota archaeon]|nr:acetyl-CoA carboxylase biotin carboxyl carrier protein subunit [Euryarchaeota archaeon]MBT4391693.1 acetyl-CoA carboxylase biotin carboxyl carrier protein subunit [Euryarchaeota archaeon]MBT4802736.1 acetyl-CoA carboxylase biotin carboxyl carrier protein subunit [Euryarchaeota archaeon]MBT5614610.1 acetyl-CoA carboxylase biotin carboxyl carrier protein subunit [Euryarchaeota archaeon]MBT6684078.1 acetyl-CoA carboxylase biotin carboxyl carrier protein subunit [Euryarchaeota archaeon]